MMNSKSTSPYVQDLREAPAADPVRRLVAYRRGRSCWSRRAAEATPNWRRDLPARPPPPPPAAAVRDPPGHPVHAGRRRHARGLVRAGRRAPGTGGGPLLATGAPRPRWGCRPTPGSAIAPAQRRMPFCGRRIPIYEDSARRGTRPGCEPCCATRRTRLCHLDPRGTAGLRWDSLTTPNAPSPAWWPRGFSNRQVASRVFLSNPPVAFHSATRL